MNYFNYFSEIEETFVRRRGKNLLLSPLDWALIEAWKERGVPLHVVLRGIETVFDAADRHPARKRSIKSLVYCRDEIENLFAVWLDAQIGSQPSETESNEVAETEIPSADVIAHLQKIAGNLRQPRPALNGSWKSFYAEVLSQLETAQNDFEFSKNLEELETKLSVIDHKIDDKLAEVFGENEFVKIKAETSGQLRSHKNRMSAEIYAETFKNLLIKNLRVHADLPRFSLFYL